MIADYQRFFRRCGSREAAASLDLRRVQEGQRGGRKEFAGRIRERRIAVGAIGSETVKRRVSKASELNFLTFALEARAARQRRWPHKQLS